MADGQIVEENTPEEFFTNPSPIGPRTSSARSSRTDLERQLDLHPIREPRRPAREQGEAHANHQELRRRPPRRWHSRWPPAATPATTTTRAPTSRWPGERRRRVRRRHADEGAGRQRRGHHRRQVRPARHRLQGRHRRHAGRLRPRDRQGARRLARHRPGGHHLEGDDLRQPGAVPHVRRGRPGAGVVLHHRRAPPGGRPGRALLHHRPAAPGQVRQRHRQPRGRQGHRGLLGDGLDVTGEHRGRGRDAASASTPTPSASTRCSAAPSTR